MIVGKKIILRDCDRKLWHKFYKKLTVDSMLGNYFYKYDKQAAEADYLKKISDKTRLYFFITLKSRVVGQIYLKNIDVLQKTTEFGITLTDDSVKGKGYGVDAISCIIDYVFNTLGFKSIKADTLLKNIRSQHILQKLGFKQITEDEDFLYYELDNCFI